MGDFKIPQGDQIMVTTNSSDLDGLIYSSNNEDVVIIENDGTLTAVAPGTAAITVTSGNVSKSIIVEVIEHVDDVGVNDLPIYTEAQKVVIDTNPVTEPVTSAPAKGTQAPTQAPTQASTQAPTQASTQAPTQAPTQASTQALTQAPTLAPTKESANATVPTTKSTDGTTTATSQNDDSYGLTSEELYDYLPTLGLYKKVSNAFVYEVDGNYTGQIILESKCVHIYVKSNSDGFNSILKEVVKLVLPSNYETVYKAYETATSDKALIVSGRKVQIIVGKNENHKQLIIYN